MKISEVTVSDVCDFLREGSTDIQQAIVAADMVAAEQYILSYTGLSASEADELPDLTTAYLVLIRDMYDCRSMNSDGKSANLTVTSILDMHARNLL